MYTETLVTIALIDGKQIRYDQAARKEVSELDIGPDYKFLGVGYFYSVDGVLQYGKDRYSFFEKTDNQIGDMAEYMDMKTAFECGDDDIPYNEDCGGFNTAKLYIKKELIGESPKIIMNPSHGLSGQWQVIKAEPKVLTTEEIMNDVSERMPVDQWEVFYVKDVADKCDKNGQLKEWQRPEQTALREAVRDLLNKGSGSDQTNLLEVFKNLKHPLEEI